jgi:hypothetical protein
MTFYGALRGRDPAAGAGAVLPTQPGTTVCYRLRDEELCARDVVRSNRPPLPLV